MKTCSRCLKDLNDSLFPKRGSWCKACRAEWQREYRRKWPDRYKQTNNKSRIVVHGITVEEFEAMVESQGGVCAVCQQPPARGRLHIDHDHKCCPGGYSCGKCIRGLLCQSCNGALGFVLDNPETLQKLLRYLAS